jgi:hypothetical protein
MDDVAVDLWFVMIPEEVYILGRPQSRIPLPNGSASSAGLIHE